MSSIAPSTPVTARKSKFDKYTVVQTNLQHAKEAWDTLSTKLINKINPIILATEPYFTKDRKLPQVNKDLTAFYSRKCTIDTPRAAVLIHKVLEDKCWELQQFTTRDQVVIRIKYGKKDIILGSVYMDGNKQVPPESTKPIIAYAKKHKLPLIVGSDTNSRHILWGDRLTNKRGGDLLDFLESNNLQWSNTGSIPTFCNSRGHTSIVDLTITNEEGAKIVKDWSVKLDHSSSDHRYIFFQISKVAKTETKPFRQTKNTNWEHYDNALDNNKMLKDLRSKQLHSKHDIDIAATQAINIVTEAYNNSCPLTYVSNSVKKPPWLTPEIQTAQKEIKHKLMKARNTKANRDWAAHRSHTKNYKKLVKKTKRESWKNFCKEAESVHESARMNKILKTCTNPHEKLNAVYNAKGKLTQDPSETLTVLIDTHFKECETGEEAEISEATSPEEQTIAKIYNEERISEAVKAFKPYKAAGPDGIQPILLQKAWKHIGAVTRNIMIASHRLQHIPAPWTESKGIFLNKPGKTDYHQAKSFRTITLAPTFLKLHERVVLWHMQHDLNMEELSSDRQHGFRKGKSTESALHKVIHKIESRIAKNGYVLGTFLDIEGAFDNVSHKAIAEAINKSPVDKSTAGWITAMVTSRKLTITHKTCTKRFHVKRGCPQGGILSPFLWNLVVEDLLQYSAKEIPGYLQAFADDLVVLCECNDYEVARARTIKSIQTIERWCKTKGLNISALKTKIINFTTKTKKSKLLLKPFMVGGKPISLSKTVKFLGVTLDSKLNFNEHITKIAEKATASLMQCKKAVGPTWGLTPKTCRWMYQAVIRPIITYCATVWIRALATDHNRKKLRSVQALALRIMSGALPGTPSEALNYITCTPDIINFLNGEAAKGASRLQAYNDWTKETLPTGSGIFNAHSTINNEFIKNLDMPKANKDLIKPKLAFNKSYKLQYPKGTTELELYKGNLKEAISKINPEAITCYTDGSKNEKDDTGYGYIITTHNNSTELHKVAAKMPNFSSVFQAEVTAITTSAIKLQGTCGKEIIFLTDSLSALQTLNNKLINSMTIKRCHNSLNELAKHNDVKLMWVEAHKGHWGNEEADTLAKEGTTSNNIVPGYIPQSHIKQQINLAVMEMDKCDWSITNYRHTNLTIGQNTKTTAKDLRSLETNREKYRAAIHLITGHAALNHHLHKMQQVETNICAYCETEEETTSHFLGTCPAFARIRGEIFNTYYASISDIFENHNIKEIARYAVKTKRFTEFDGPDPGGGQVDTSITE